MSRVNPTWPMIERHINDRIAAVHVQLETASPGEVLPLQAEAKALRDLLKLPEILIDDPAKRLSGDRSGY